MKPTKPSDVYVTDHALFRYRERCATYANAKIQDVQQTFLEARRVTRSEPLPCGIHQRPGMAYYYHQPSAVCFVVRWETTSKPVIVSVIPVVPGLHASGRRRA